MYTFKNIGLYIKKLWMYTLKKSRCIKKNSGRIKKIWMY